MDLFTLTKSRTRQKILDLFLSHPDKDYYLRELEKKLSISAGNIRREFISLLKTGLFQKYSKGRLLYYKINTKSELYQVIHTLMHKKTQISSASFIDTGFSYMFQRNYAVSSDWSCQTRDVFQVRLQTFHEHLEKSVGVDIDFLTAIVGEIGNNSFDHNLGRWPDNPGVLFAHDAKQRIIIIADRGVGIFATIQFVRPDVKDHQDALHIAFTEVISGRKDEHRGNGLKFVLEAVKKNNWNLQFYSGNAFAQIDKKHDLRISRKKEQLHGCLAIIRY